jgi:hypothetical protein
VNSIYREHKIKTLKTEIEAAQEAIAKHASTKADVARLKLGLADRTKELESFWATSDDLLGSIRDLEDSLIQDDARSSYSLDAISELTSIFEPLVHSESALMAAKLLLVAGNKFSEAAHEVVQRSTLNDSQKMGPRALLLRLSQGLASLPTHPLALAR